MEDEVAVARGEEEVLPAAAGARQGSAFEGGKRGVERLQRGDVRRARLLDRRSGHGVVQLASIRLDLRVLGHRFLSWTRSA